MPVRATAATRRAVRCPGARPPPQRQSWRTMINEVDEALRTLVKADVVNGDGRRDPLRRAHAGLGLPAEHAEHRPVPLRPAGGHQAPVGGDLRAPRRRGMVTERQALPRYFKLAYLITAWTQRPEDEHRLLSAILACFMRYDVLPAFALTPMLAETRLPAGRPDRLSAARGPPGVRRVVVGGRRPQAVGRPGDHPGRSNPTSSSTSPRPSWRPCACGPSGTPRWTWRTI